MNMSPQPRADAKTLSHWGALAPTHLPLLLRALPKGRMLMAVTDSVETAGRLHAAWSFFWPERPAALFPGWEVLPYDRFSPHSELVADRLKTLWGMKNKRIDALVVSASDLAQKVAPTSYVDARAFILKKGDAFDFAGLQKSLDAAGYRAALNVVAPGEYAVRGSLVDVFPMGAEHPFRVDLFDDEIDSLRFFDPDTNETLSRVESIGMMPAHEFPTDDEAIKVFQKRYLQTMGEAAGSSSPYLFVKERSIGAGVEFYQPLFFEQGLSPLTDYLPQDALIVRVGDLESAAQAFEQDAQERYRAKLADALYPPLEPRHLYMGAAEIAELLSRFDQIAVDLPGPAQPKPGEPGAAGSGGLAGGKTGDKTGAAPDALRFDFGADPKEAYARFLLNARDGAPGSGAQSQSRAQAQGAKAKSGAKGRASGKTAAGEPAQDGLRRVLIVADSLGRRETILGGLRERGVDARGVDSWAEFADCPERACVTSAPGILGGFRHDPDALSSLSGVKRAGLGGDFDVVTEFDVDAKAKFATTRRRPTVRTRRSRKFDADFLIQDMASIREGDPVVHVSHGVGIYRGLTRKTIQGREYELLSIEYKDGAQLFIPVSYMNLISRYAGVEGERVELDELGGKKWQKNKKKAMEQARDAAAELLRLYALRSAQTGAAVRPDPADCEAFAEGFPYEETEDQKTAIEATLRDMASPKPMDRLICGDVGFGKTEVALRAAFAAVSGGKQVAVLVPTTLLAEQHAEVFRRRFMNFPVRIEALSRFQSKAQTGPVLEGLADGRVDIVIGTHKLLQPDVAFANLGLVIVDEEHRFGVRQKEALKRLRVNVDVLTMTATPIPRTLSMAMEGLRSMSIIATPPSRRLPVRTFVKDFSAAIIQDAANRELLRGGQVFFVHNDVQTQEEMAIRLRKMLPRARIAIANGQMRERELEKVMRGFLQNETNFLICSTIVETGIDIPNANTILINRADKFGLAQLHQLRGRVGRSHHQAYCYMLVPDVLSRKAKLRLEAIAEAGELGAGFNLALHDLEIRGAGEILGEEQAGEVAKVGLTMYAEILKKAVDALRAGRDPDSVETLENDADVSINAPALIPESYCPDPQKRLDVYNRLSSCADDDELDAALEKVIDKRGAPPEPLLAYVATLRMRMLCEKRGIASASFSNESMTLSFAPDNSLNVPKMLRLIGLYPYAFAHNREKNTLKIMARMPNPAAMSRALKTFVEALDSDSDANPFPDEELQKAWAARQEELKRAAARKKRLAGRPVSRVRPAIRSGGYGTGSYGSYGSYGSHAAYGSCGSRGPGGLGGSIRPSGLGSGRTVGSAARSGGSDAPRLDWSKLRDPALKPGGGRDGSGGARR